MEEEVLKTFNRIKGETTIRILGNREEDSSPTGDYYEDLARSHLDRHYLIDVVQLAKLYAEGAVKMPTMNYVLSVDNPGSDGLKLLLRYRLVKPEVLQKIPVKQRYIEETARDLLSVLPQVPDKFQRLLWSLTLSVLARRRFNSGLALYRRRIEVSTEYKQKIDPDTAITKIESTTWWERKYPNSTTANPEKPEFCKMLLLLGAKPYIGS